MPAQPTSNAGAAPAAAPAGGVPSHGLSPALSDAIRVMRLPLLLGPLLVHACLAPQRSLLQYVLARIIGDVSVPAFFFVSGLLYFSTFDGTVRCYLRKLRSRVCSLAVPYLLWNLIGYFLLAYAVHMVAKGDFLKSFWGVRVAYRSVSTAPVDGPLYFIKGLFFLAIAAPAAYWALRRRMLAWFAPAAVIFWIASPISALADRMAVIAIAMFSLGGFFALRLPNYLAQLTTSHRAATAAIVAFLASAAVNIALHASGIDFAPALRLNILFGIPAWFAVAGMLSRGGAAPLLRRAQGFAMFLFCSFDLIIAFSRKLWHPLRAQTDAMCLKVALMTFTVSLTAYLLLSLVARPLLRLLVGDRR